MNLLRTAVLAAATVAFVTPVLSQGTTEPWDLKERNVYVMDMQGKMWSKAVNDKSMASMMKGAKKVPKGTVFFMSGGQLMMVQRGAFDKSGAFMFN